MVKVRQEVEGFMFINETPIPVSLKRFPSENIKNPFRNIRDNAGKIESNIRNFQGNVLIGDNPNTILRAEILLFAKNELLDYINKNPNILPKKGIYKEIILIPKDGSLIKFDKDLNIIE